MKPHSYIIFRSLIQPYSDLGIFVLAKLKFVIGRKSAQKLQTPLHMDFANKIVITLMMEAVRISATSVNFYHTTSCNIPEDRPSQ
jgi:hypothetical protein